MRTFMILLAMAVLAACSSVKSSGTMNADTSKNSGWISLFDGKTTNGWHGYGNTPVPIWEVNDGALFLNVAKKTDKADQYLVSDEEFDNFHLKLDWKIIKDGNSGIIFYVNEDTTRFKHPYNSGPEMQVLDNEGHPDAKIPKHRAGDLYDLIASSKETVKPAGEWNHAEIISNKGKLDFYLNGTNIVSTTLWDDHWRNLIAGSKFNTMPGFGTFRKGHISLQDHGDNVWFKNIMIKRL